MLYNKIRYFVYICKPCDTSNKKPNSKQFNFCLHMLTNRCLHLYVYHVDELKKIFSSILFRRAIKKF